MGSRGSGVVAYDPPVKGLYPIIDVARLARVDLPVVSFLEAVLSARPALVQLRAKDLGARDTLALLRACKPLADAAGSLLFANDRPDLAKLAGCHGVHLGQSDVPASEVRRWFPELSIGVSTHSFAQVEAALLDAPDYVAHGPVYPTESKRAPDPVVGLEGLARAAAELAGRCPLVAIGGIDLASASEVSKSAELGAVIGALIPDSRRLEDVASRARELHAALSGGP